MVIVAIVVTNYNEGVNTYKAVKQEIVVVQDRKKSKHTTCDTFIVHTTTMLHIGDTLKF